MLEREHPNAVGIDVHMQQKEGNNLKSRNSGDQHAFNTLKFKLSPCQEFQAKVF